MSITKKAITSALFFLLMSSCGKQHQEDSGITLVLGSKIANSAASPEQKAEEYGKSAELLLTAQGFSQAKKLAALGLEQDPKNLRSGFVYALSAMVDTQRGIYNRILPLVEKDPKALEKHNLELANIKEKSGVEKYKFLTDGQPDIHTEVELQDHIDLSVKAAEEFRQFVNKHKDSELTIKANTTLVSDLVERYTDACEIKETGNFDFQLICPPHQARYDVTLNRADFEVLAYTAAVTEIYLLSLNAYDLSGSAVVRFKFPEESTTPEIIAAELAKNPAFGKLRKQARLQEIKALGLDLVGGLNWASKNQNTLCPAGVQNAKNRVGKWMNKGFCIRGVTETHFDIVTKTLKGEVLSSKSVKGDDSYTANAAYGQIFLNPPQDLRSLGPLKFDACRNLVEVGDLTLAGIFPDGDANKVLPLAFTKCGRK